MIQDQSNEKSIEQQLNDNSTSNSSDCTHNNIETLNENSVHITSRGRIVKENFNWTEYELTFQKALSNLSQLTPTPPSPGTNDTYASPKAKTLTDIDEQQIELPFERVIISHRKCCLCLKSDGNMVVIPDEARIQAFKKIRVYIPKNNRCCKHHLIRKVLIESLVREAKIFSKTSILSASEVELFVNNISDASSKGIHYEVKQKWLSDEEIKILTGFSWTIIEEIEKMLPSLRNSTNRNPLQALVIFLTKL